MRSLIKPHIISILLSLVVLPVNANCQNKIDNLEYTSEGSTKSRELYAFINSGIFEWFGWGLGYQFNDEFGVKLKHSNNFLSGHGGSPYFPPYGSGYGIELLYLRNMWLFNNISLSFTYLNTVPYKYEEIKEHGKSFELSIGYENIEQGEKGKLHFFWSIGIGLGTTTAYKETLLMPTIKIGLTRNLF